MSKILSKLGSFIAKHKWWSVLAWIVLLAAVITPLTSNAPEFDNDIEMNGLKSLDTNEKIGDEFNQDSEKASIRIVFHTNSDDGITEESMKEDIQETLDNIKKNDDYVEGITDPYETEQINDDETTAFADINYVVSQTNLKDASIDNVNDELDDLKDQHLIQTEMTGGGPDIDVGGISEVIGIIAAFIILLITFGSLVAAGMPIVSALIGLGSGVGIISLLTYTFDIPDVTLTLAVMIGLAVGIDYSLFILSRYREIIKTEKSHVKAVGLALGTAGSAVVFAGVTVIIAVCGLSLIGIDFLAVMGFSSAISVFVAVLSALTLLPAIISIFHKHIRPKQNKVEKKDTTTTPWSKFVVGKPVLALFLGLVILVVAALPMSHMRLGIPDDGMSPDNTTEKKGYDIISDEFGEGYNGQIAMLVNVKDKNDQDTLEQDLDNVTDDIKDMSNVDMVAPAQLNENNDYALIGIIPEEGPNAESTNDLVHDLRDYHDQAKDEYNFETEISGQSVINIDMSKKLNDAIPVFAGVIIALAFVLLMTVFRSIIIPLKAVLGFVLSLTATLGFTTLIMQDGFMNEWFNVGTTGPLLAFLPVIVIGVLFGLAIDYEIFLMSRIHEEYSKTHDNEHSIKVGLKESGSVIIAAALIMFSVFIAFVFQDDVMIKSMGLALAFGVLFDAIIVRMTLIPALTKLFGSASWYMPKWLDRLLPKIDVEGHALQAEMSPSNEQESSSSDSLSIASRVSGIEIDQVTQHLYNDLLSVSSDQKVLFNGLLYSALMNYAKDHNKEIYNKYLAHADEHHVYDQHHLDTNRLSSGASNDSQQDENTDTNTDEQHDSNITDSKDPDTNQSQLEEKDDDMKKLLEEQKRNNEQMNDILSRLLDREDNK